MSAQNLSSFPARFAAQINDATGITNTITTAGTVQELKGALFLEVLNTLPTALTWSAANGTLTVAKHQAAGKYLAEFFPSNTIGTNAAQKIHHIGVDGVVKGAPSSDKEAATAVGTSAGAAVAVIDLVVGSVVTVEQDVGTNGHAITTKSGTLVLTKIG